MKYTQENGVSMLRTVVISGDKMAAVLGTIPILDANFQVLKGKVNLIEDVKQNQAASIKGFAKAKTRSRLKLIDHVMVAAGMLCSYAGETEDDVLSELVKITRSTLKHMRDEAMYDISKVIIEKATELQANMGPYGLTPVLLAKMQNALDDYHAKTETPAEARNNRKYYTRQLSILIREAMQWLRERIDGHMEVLRATHPDVVEKYFNSRMIFDYSGGKKRVVPEDSLPAMLSGTVTDTDGLPVADALVRVEGTTINTTTDADGEYLIDTLQAGSYNLVVSLEGYKEAKENNFKVVAGDDVVKDFVIEAE